VSGRTDGAGRETPAGDASHGPGRDAGARRPPYAATRRAVAGGVVACVAAIACGSPGPPARAADREVSADGCATQRAALCVRALRVADAPRVFEATGRLVSITPQYATIAHDDIPGLMPPMTMEFELASTRLARQAKPGQPVRFTLEVRGPDLRITALRVEAPPARPGAAQRPAD
jgi:Cu/Ag efflux protein CusF